MGMYDEVKVSPKLLDDVPDSWHNKGTVMFQTKDIQRPMMEMFKISNDKLLKRERKREQAGTRTLEVGDEALELPQYETVNETWNDCEYHGSFEFHRSWPPDARYEDEAYEWYSYEAWFNRGELQEVLKHPDR